MSKHFSANQYNDAFLPKRIKNWQYGINHPGAHPRRNHGSTVPIVDSNGRFLPGARRSSLSSPWGDYSGWIWEEMPYECSCVDQLRHPQDYNQPTSTIIVTRERPHPVQEAKAVSAMVSKSLFQQRLPSEVSQNLGYSV